MCLHVWQSSGAVRQSRPRLEHAWTLHYWWTNSQTSSYRHYITYITFKQPDDAVLQSQSQREHQQSNLECLWNDLTLWWKRGQRSVTQLAGTNEWWITHVHTSFMVEQCKVRTLKPGRSSKVFFFPGLSCTGLHKLWILKCVTWRVRMNVSVLHFLI